MDAEVEQLKGEIANLMAMISLVEAQIAAMDDDIPEPDLRNSEGGESSATWSGIVWYIGELKWDFSKASNDPAGAASEFGMYGVETVVEEEGPKRYYRGTVTGAYLKVKLVNGSCAFSDSIDDDVDEYSYYPVAQVLGQDDDEANIYGPVSGRTIGDIRIEMVPYWEPIEEEEALT